MEETQGQKEYSKYLNSAAWLVLRDARLDLDNYLCCMCRRDASCVHHMEYAPVWGEETLDMLVSLCDRCHNKVHTHIDKLKATNPNKSKEWIRNISSNKLRRKMKDAYGNFDKYLLTIEGLKNQLWCIQRNNGKCKICGKDTDRISYDEPPSIENGISVHNALYCICLSCLHKRETDKIAKEIERKLFERKKRENKKAYRKPEIIEKNEHRGLPKNKLIKQP